MSVTSQAPDWMIRLAARAKANQLTEIDRLWARPQLIFEKINKTPDPWQLECLKTNKDLILNCSRQCGKSWTTSAIAILTLLRQAPSLVLIISPSERQSGELMKDKFMPMYQPWKTLCPMIKDNEGEKAFANGSRLVALPGKSDANIRSYASVALLIVDEASRVPDAIYDAVTPMLLVSKGKQVVLSTPFGKRGWFYREWTEGQDWHKVSIRADQCPRFTPAQLEKEKAKKGRRVFNQEYCCSFEESVGAVFLEEDIVAAYGGGDIDGFGPMDLFGPVGGAPPIYMPRSEEVLI